MHMAEEILPIFGLLFFTVPDHDDPILSTHQHSQTKKKEVNGTVPTGVPAKQHGPFLDDFAAMVSIPGK